MKEANTMLEGRSRYNGVVSDVSARWSGPNSFCRKYLVNTYFKQISIKERFKSLQFEIFWLSNKPRNYRTNEQNDALYTSKSEFVQVLIQYYSNGKG